MPASSGIDFNIDGSRHFHEVVAKMKGPTGKALRLETAKAIRTEAAPVVVHLKARVLAIESHIDGGRSSATSGATARARHAGSRKSQSGRAHGLRAAVARSIGVKVRLTANRPGVTIRVDAAQLPPEQRTLPAALNKAKWRHPVFGTDRWVSQTGAPRWWQDTVREHEPIIREALRKVMHNIAQKL